MGCPRAPNPSAAGLRECHPPPTGWAPYALGPTTRAPLGPGPGSLRSGSGTGTALGTPQADPGRGPGGSANARRPRGTAPGPCARILMVQSQLMLIFLT